MNLTKSMALKQTGKYQVPEVLVLTLDIWPTLYAHDQVYGEVLKQTEEMKEGGSVFTPQASNVSST